MWSWLNAAFNFEEASIIFYMILHPQETDDFEHLDIARAAIIETNIIQFELRRTIANRCAEDCSSSRNHIQHRHVFRDTDRVIKGQDYDIRSQGDARGSSGNTGQCHQRRGPIMIANTMMFFEPNRIEPE